MKDDQFKGLDQLVEQVVFGARGEQDEASREIWNMAQEQGIYPASIEALYRAFALGETDACFTVPAVNMRAVTYHSARGVFRAMKATNATAVIFELSRGEIGFTGQRPQEYTANILAAAIAEGHVGPVFLQGDHFQISASRLAENSEQELNAVRMLITEGIAAGFYNIDIDASTIGDASLADAQERLAPNANYTAQLIEHARRQQPDGITLSLGGEIGEIGEENSTPEEIRTYLSSITDQLPVGVVGLSNISIQSGTRHGGNILADGTVGDMPIDFDLISELSCISREEFGLGGCVQHGASLLTMEKIGGLPATGCIEVHLAAAFLNAVYDCLPKDVVAQADEWILENFSDEWKEGWSKPQFLQHARRYPIGPSKKLWWAQTEVHTAITDKVAALAGEYIERLGAVNSRAIVEKFIQPILIDWASPQTASSDDAVIADLAS